MTRYIYFVLIRSTLTFNWILGVFRYEIPVVFYSILFAEAFPIKWEEKGAGRRVLNDFWKFGAMFIVLVYLCNLRSHLIKAIKVAPPNSLEDLALPKYTYKLLGLYWYKNPNNFLPIESMKKQNRIIISNGKKEHCLISLAKPFSFLIPTPLLFPLTALSSFFLLAKFFTLAHSSWCPIDIA